MKLDLDDIPCDLLLGLYGELVMQRAKRNVCTQRIEVCGRVRQQI